MILKLKFNFNFNIKFIWRGVSMFNHLRKAILLAGLACCAVAARAQENYFITYTHQMEEPGNLEVAIRTVNGFPRDGHAFTGSAVGLQYGAQAWGASQDPLHAPNPAGPAPPFSPFPPPN